MLNEYKNKSILITGGTGSFGKAFCQSLIDNKIKPKKLIIFSRDEFKQTEMEKKFPSNKFPFFRFFIGDVRDSDRLLRAFHKVDIVIHASALKHVSTGEYNPFEVIKTNVIGAQNVVDACLENNVKNVIALSTDKASSPINLYGASKLCSDKIFIAANNYTGSRQIKFSVVRYGNVLGSRGSVLPIFIKSSENSNVFNVTHKDMTRFNITLNQGVNFVHWCIANNNGGEIFIPKLDSYNVTDIAKAISKNARFNIIGIKPGEKIHEELLSSGDSINSMESKKFYVIFNYINSEQSKRFIKKHSMKKVKNRFVYSSETCKKISIKNLKKLISEFKRNN